MHPDTTLHYSGRVALAAFRNGKERRVACAAGSVQPPLLQEPPDEPGDLPACVTRTPSGTLLYCCWGSLTANNLRDLRLVACLPLDAASLTDPPLPYRIGPSTGVARVQPPEPHD